MSKLIFLLTLMSLSSFGQEKNIDINRYIQGKDRIFLDSFINAGYKDFHIVERMHIGLMYEAGYDSCKDEGFVKFTVVKAKDSNKYEFIKYGNCGQTHVTTESKALQFFEENRDQIKSDTVKRDDIADPTIYYAFYEFREGKLKTRIIFCKACVDHNKTTSGKSQKTKTYEFFSMLDIEISKQAKYK